MIASLVRAEEIDQLGDNELLFEERPSTLL